MTEAVRRRRSLLRLAMLQKDIREYDFESSKFLPPSQLQVPPDLQNLQVGLIKRAEQAIHAMTALMNQRETRYNALCPQTAEITYRVHKTSIERLLLWKQDWNMRDPTLAPAVKIPRDTLHFHLDPLSYAAFTTEYISQLEAFMSGPFTQWITYKSHVQYSASRVLDEITYSKWRDWWDNSFTSAMWIWEICLEGLIVPTWEEMVDDIYLLILERVEDAGDLATSLCSSRTTSQMNTPQAKPTAAEYFASSA
ncbi:hypothetical protein N7492_004422 [Penicillium capsulatum]|uniref:Uncharacterized protein n=1 Tax=Penicillium capsulatum TaxID=69766 RepID=A0A9W9I9V1_9EURO|nr:hypothetical protein N7492_004422 [Penicillium capsulatum]KAJ6136458.1 hypothetical protein N7512_001618 [Penicillium capsulatum]